MHFISIIRAQKLTSRWALLSNIKVCCFSAGTSPADCLDFYCFSSLPTTSRTSKNSLSYNTITHSVKVVQEFSNTICKNLLADELSSPLSLASLASLSAVLPLLEGAFCPFSTLMGRVTAVVATKQWQKHLILGDPHQKQCTLNTTYKYTFHPLTLSSPH